MAAKRGLNSVLLAAIESTEGIAASIVPSTDIVLVENMQIKFNESMQTTNEVTGTLDQSQDIPIGGPCAVTFDTWVKGSGLAGTAPEVGKLFKACAWGETLVAAPIGVPTAATAGTGSSVTVPASPFNGAVDAYRGMAVQLTGNPVGPAFALIRSFSAGQVMALAETFSPVLSPSTLVQIPAQVLYSPVSPPTSIPSLTFHVYKDSVRHIVVGARGTLQMTLEAGKGVKISWSFSGILQSARTDTSNPAGTSPDAAVAKLVWRNDANNGGFTVDGVRIGVMRLAFDNGVSVDNAPNPNQPAGFDLADIGSRDMKIEFNPRLANIATRDFLARKQAGTTGHLSAYMRRAAGNSFGLFVPQYQITAYDYEDQGPMIGEKISCNAVGNNSGAFISYF
jgi:hypothetical protein